jgi:hypothetical protein
MSPCENKHNSSTSVQEENESADQTLMGSTEGDNDVEVKIHEAIERKLANDREPKLQSIMKKDEPFMEFDNTTHANSEASCPGEDEMNTNTKSKSVQFSALQIRSFPMILGDHPCCMTGLPVSLDWDHTKEEVVPIEEYESNREARSSRSSLRMDQSTRSEILGQISDQNDLKRAERKLFREREGKRRMTASDFFGKPLIESQQE